MYLIDTHQTPTNRLVGFNTSKREVIQELINDALPERTDPQLAEIDMKQTGSGFKGLKNKMRKMDLHSDAKKKYNKFISLNL